MAMRTTFAYQHTPLPLLLLLSLLPSALSSSSQVCYWANQNTVSVEDASSAWFACNNTQLRAGGAQLCCLNGGQCGEDSICHTVSSSDGGSGWYVGGCTDPSYQDPVCRTSCGTLGV